MHIGTLLKELQLSRRRKIVAHGREPHAKETQFDTYVESRIYTTVYRGTSTSAGQISWHAEGDGRVEFDEDAKKKDYGHPAAEPCVRICAHLDVRTKLWQAISILCMDQGKAAIAPLISALMVRCNLP